MTAKILVVDDEKKVREVVRSYLEEEGFEVITISRGDKALERIFDEEFDLLVLDLMLPGTSGEEIAGTVRERSDLPIIMLTARSNEEERVAGFERGADDYLVKPFSPRELGARVKAVLKRAGIVMENEKTIELPRHSLKVYPQAREVYLEDERVELTSTQFKLLHTFIKHAGQVLSREQLVDRVLGLDYEGYDRTIDVHIKNLRQKLNIERDELIETVYGMGYRLSRSEIDDES